jgi:MarR family 2-MHQ and catechol resistance regulon transcriptional repressor
MQRGQNSENLVMDKDSSAPVRCWLAWVKAFQAASKYLYAGIEETGLCDTDFLILEALLNKGPLPLNTIGARVNLTPGPISVGVDRLFEKGLVTRVESPEDRRVRVVSLTSKGKGLITPIFRKHSAEIRKVFADASQKEVRNLETILKKIGNRATSLGTGMKPRSRSCRSETGYIYNNDDRVRKILEHRAAHVDRRNSRLGRSVGSLLHP